MGTGRYAKASATCGQYIRGIELGFVEPYFFDQRLSAGIDLFARDTLASPHPSYGTASYGTSLKMGVPLWEDLSFQGRYSIYWSEINLVSSLNDCNNVNRNFATTFPTLNAANAVSALGVGAAAYPIYPMVVAGGGQSNCQFLSQLAPGNGVQVNAASLPVREELAAGGYLTSMVGYGLTYNTLDNNKRPTSSILVNFGQDFAGLGGNAYYLRTVVDFRTYYEMVSGLVGAVHLQGGDMFNLSKGPNGESNYARMLDDFKVGPKVVRGFQPAGIGPRDITPGTAGDALGGTYYWGASLEVQYPFYFLPKDSGFRGAVFVDSGAEWGYKRETAWPSNGEVNGLITANTGLTYVCGNCALQFADTAAPRLSVGASLIWDSPFGPLRFDFAYPILKQAYDRTQWFQFGGPLHRPIHLNWPYQEVGPPFWPLG
jgi:outer membrane protein insertion porin family